MLFEYERIATSIASKARQADSRYERRRRNLRALRQLRRAAPSLAQRPFRRVRLTEVMDRAAEYHVHRPHNLGVCRAAISHLLWKYLLVRLSACIGLKRAKGKKRE